MVPLHQQFTKLENGQFNIPNLSYLNGSFFDIPFSHDIRVLDPSAIQKGADGITPQQLLGVVIEHFKHHPEAEFNGYISAAVTNLKIALYQLAHIDGISNNENIGEYLDD